jgi:protocatechuate 3,4-dioxygenase beta subunit
VQEDVDVGTLVLKRGAVISGRVVDNKSQPVANASVMRRGNDAAQDPTQAGRGTGGRGGPGSQFMMMGGGPGGPGGMEFMGGEAMDLMRGMVGDVLTDADGRFEMPNEAPGEFSLRVRHAEYPPASRDGLSLALGQTMADVLIVLEPGAEIRGHVSAIPDSAKNVRVLAGRVQQNAGGNGNDMFGGMGAQFMEMMGDFALAAERSAEVAADGTFAVKGLPVGQRFRIWVTQGGRGSFSSQVCSERVEVQSGTKDVELRFDPGSTVTAKVVDAKTGKPVEVLYVRDQLEGGGMADMMGAMTGMMGRNGRARTYPQGLVTLSSLRPKEKQTLRLTIEAIGYRKFEQREIALPPQGTVDLGTVRLEPMPVVRVEVKTKKGEPVAEATVRLRGQRQSGGNDFASMMENFANGDMGNIPGPMGMMGGGGGIGQAKTDEKGRAVLNAIVDGPFTVVVNEKNFAPFTSEQIAPRPDADIEQKVTLLVGGTVEVTALDAEGKPVADARIERQATNGPNDNKQGDANGRAVFEHLPPGTHRFRLATGAGGGPMQFMMGGRGGRNRGAGAGGGGGGGAAAEAEWQSVEVADEARAELTLSKDATATLTGIVRENGQPLAGARVQFLSGPGDDQPAAGGNRDPMAAAMDMFGQMGGGRGERTDDQGRYTLKELKAGQHRVRVTATGRSMATTVKVFLRNGNNVQDFDLDSASVRGTVVDPSGKPVAGATVRVVAANDTTPSFDGMVQGMNFGGRGGRGGMNLGGMMGGGNTVTTEADGRFELKGVQTGASLVVRASAKGFAGGESAPFDALASGKDGIEVKLNAGGTIKVTASSNQPFAAVSAVMEGDGAGKAGPTFALLNNGTATLEGLRPGTWRVSMQAGMGGMFGGRGGRGGNNANANAGNEGVVVTVVAGQTVEVSL